MNFGARLKELRKENGLRQQDLAQMLNVHNTTVSAWETGDNEPDFKTLIKIATIFGVSTDFLLDNHV